MRHFLAFVTVAVSMVLGQTYVVVEEDSVEFGMTNLSRNCGAQFVMHIEQSDSIFTIIAVDSGGLATCGTCYFDVEVALSGIEVGQYVARFYTYDIVDIAFPDSNGQDWEYVYDMSYIGQMDFTIESPPSAQFAILSSYQSPCSHTQSTFEGIQPADRTLISIYPNPFNSSTNIEFILHEDDVVRVTVHNVQGRELDELGHGGYAAGIHELHWEAKDVPSGVYLISINTSRSIITRKMLLLK